MKTDLPPTLPPLAAHPPPEVPQTALPVLPLIPGVAVRPSLADEFIAAAPTQDFNLTRDLTVFARVRAEGGRRVVAIFAV